MCEGLALKTHVWSEFYRNTISVLCKHNLFCPSEIFFLFYPFSFSFIFSYLSGKPICFYSSLEALSFLPKSSLFSITQILSQLFNCTSVPFVYVLSSPWTFYCFSFIHLLLYFSAFCLLFRNFYFPFYLSILIILILPLTFIVLQSLAF